MLINCKDQECPQPVINTKKSLESLADDDILEVLLNSKASIENVKRFATNQGYTIDEDRLDDKSVKLTIVKGYNCELVDSNADKKTLFLKDDKIGEGELGEKLVVGFLSSILELPNLPKEIICVNRAVFLTTSNINSVEVLKQLEQKGVQIYSCGVCLEHFALTNDLKVGSIGNAYGTVESLFNSNGVISL